MWLQSEQGEKVGEEERRKVEGPCGLLIGLWLFLWGSWESKRDLGRCGTLPDLDIPRHPWVVVGKRDYEVKEGTQGPDRRRLHWST